MFIKSEMVFFCSIFIFLNWCIFFAKLIFNGNFSRNNSHPIFKFNQQKCFPDHKFLLEVISFIKAVHLLAHLLQSECSVFVGRWDIVFFVCTLISGSIEGPDWIKYDGIGFILGWSIQDTIHIGIENSWSNDATSFSLFLPIFSSHTWQFLQIFSTASVYCLSWQQAHKFELVLK